MLRRERQRVCAERACARAPALAGMPPRAPTVPAAAGRGMLYAPSQVTLPPAAAVRAEHERRVNMYMASGYAAASKEKAWRCIRLYFQWCQMANIYPHMRRGGITDYELAMFIAWLAETRRAATVEKYVSMGVRLVHQAVGIEWTPPSQRFFSKITLRGVKRCQGDLPPRRKLPITVHLLLTMHRHVDHTTVNGRAFWAACMVLFFCFLRKAHVAVKNTVDKQTMLLRDVRLAGDRFVITIRHTKTRQYNSGLGADALQYVLPRVRGSPLCPCAALSAYLVAAEEHLAPHQPVFIQLAAAAAGVRVFPLTYARFLASLKACIARAGLDPTLYAGQSFRRGGATFALEAGVPDTVIRAMGDWKSDVWKDYVSATAKLRESAALSLARAVHLAEREDSPIIH